MLAHKLWELVCAGVTATSDLRPDGKSQVTVSATRAEPLRDPRRGRLKPAQPSVSNEDARRHHRDDHQSGDSRADMMDKQTKFT
jgi:hypothetical protein